MVYSIFNIGAEFMKWLNFLVPAAIVIICVIIASSITKGYRSFIEGVVVIFKSKWSFLFFVICLGALIYFWLELKEILGWV